MNTDMERRLRESWNVLTESLRKRNPETPQEEYTRRVRELARAQDAVECHKRDLARFLLMHRGQSFKAFDPWAIERAIDPTIETFVGSHEASNT